MKAAFRGSKRFCISCGYELRVLYSGRCSECGTKFDPLNPRTFATSPSPLFRLPRNIPRLRSWIIANLRTINCSTCGGELCGQVPGRCPKCNSHYDPRNANSVCRLLIGVPRLFLRLRNGEFWRGMAIPCVLIVYGAYCVRTETAFLPGLGNAPASMSELMNLSGPPAICMGWAWVGGGFAMHCHFFWGRIEPVWRYSMIGVVIGCGMVAAGWSIALAIAVHQTLG